MDSVFSRLHGAVTLGSGIELSAADVWLLHELAGDALA